MNKDKQDEIIQYCFGEFNEKKQVVWNDLHLQHKSLNAKAYCYMPPIKVVPIIFLPGIMGSNLKNKATGDSIWRIRHTNSGMVMDALAWLFTSAERRRELLNPNTVVTDYNQNVENNNKEATYFAVSRHQRGWGGALGYSYTEPLERLQKELLLWEDYYNKAKKEGKGSNNEAQQFFKEKSIFSRILNKSLSDEDKKPLLFSETCKYRNLLLPLHVFGYNWLQSNSRSAQDLSDYIDNVLNMYKPNINGGFGHGLAFNKGEEKVILITHSMGGLVARYASELLESPCKNKILGIIHGVMPDLGAPSTYKMIKIGDQTFPMGLVVGGSANRLMSVLAQAPAALQLLPSAKYNHGRPWLRIEKGSPDGKTDLLLPNKSEPFEEVYLRNNIWWQMYEPDILDKDPLLIKENLKSYEKIIMDSTSPFINKMDGNYHDNTYLFYGAFFDANLPNDSRRSEETKTWKLQKKTSWFWVSDNSRYTTEYGDKREYTLIKSNNMWQHTKSGKEEGGPGDGTVPLQSINLTANYKDILKTNIGHQKAYQFEPFEFDEDYNVKGGISAAIKFTLRSLCRILESDDVKIS